MKKFFLKKLWKLCEIFSLYELPPKDFWKMATFKFDRYFLGGDRECTGLKDYDGNLINVGDVLSRKFENNYEECKCKKDEDEYIVEGSGFGKNKLTTDCIQENHLVIIGFKRKMTAEGGVE